MSCHNCPHHHTWCHNEHDSVYVTMLKRLHSVWKNVLTSTDHNSCKRQAQRVQLDT